MFFKNQIDIEGRLCQTPELKTSMNGTHYCRFSICHNQARKDRETGTWNNTPHFFNCVTFKTMAETVSTYKKGDPVTIGGILQYSQYEKDGGKRTSVSILVNSIKLLYLPKKEKSEKYKKEDTDYMDESQREFEKNIAHPEDEYDEYNSFNGIPF